MLLSQFEDFQQPTIGPMVQGDTQAPAISSLLIRTVSVDQKVSITHYLMVLIQTSRKSDHSSDN